MEPVELTSNEMCCDLIIESVRYYSLYCFDIREFLRVYGKRRMMEDIRDAIKYDDVENEIMELLHYVVSHPNSNASDSIRKLVYDYYRFNEKKILTFKIRTISKLIIINRMIKEGYV